jgi:hypothetical protein
MKLNFLRPDAVKAKPLIEDTDTDGDDELTRPFGIEEERWNDDLKRRLAGVKKSNPKLYSKIIHGD